jgi:hypothetical protein
MGSFYSIIIHVTTIDACPLFMTRADEIFTYVSLFGSCQQTTGLLLFYEKCPIVPVPAFHLFVDSIRIPKKPFS